MKFTILLAMMLPVAQASLITSASASCAGILSMTDPTSASCSVTFPSDGLTGFASASGQAAAFSVSASAALQYGSSLHSGPITSAFSAAFSTGDYILTFIGPDGSGGLYAPDFNLFQQGDPADSGTAAFTINGATQMRDTSGFSGFICSGGFVRQCGRPFLFNTPILIHLELFASAATNGKHVGVDSSVSFGGFETYVDGVQASAGSLVPTPEPSSWLLMATGFAGLAWLVLRKSPSIDG